jgi:hypothetical protein
MQLRTTKWIAENLTDFALMKNIPSEIIASMQTE